MKKIIPLIAILFIVKISCAQIRGFGNIDTADLKMTSCSFEKDANAMVLFDRAKVIFSIAGALGLEQHKRIKIFNEKGKDEANVKIEYDNMYGVDHIVNIEAQTINLENGKIVVHKVDPKQIFPQHTDKNRDAIVISFPDIQPGSVVEYRYTMARSIASNFPAWYFQSDIPTRYSEFDVYFSSMLQFKSLERKIRPFLKDTTVVGGHTWAAADMPSAKDEAYMRARGDALQSVSLLLTSVQAFDGKIIQLNDSWETMGRKLTAEKDYFKELDQHLSGEDTLIKQVNTFQKSDEKIAYIFGKVQSTISWNGYSNWGSKDGIKNAWKKRVGNSAEVNAILYHLLRKSGIEAYPMLVSTRENGLLQAEFVDQFQLNDLVTYVPLPDKRYYILDATEKFNTYNQVPYNLLNSYGLMLDKDKGDNKMVYIENKNPSTQIILITADISAAAKMQGTCQLSASSYDRRQQLELYKKSTEEQFRQFLTGDNNNIKISNLKLDNMQTDTLPLIQNFNFTCDLTNSDNYIFFTPNIFTPLHNNPFLSEMRSAGIDFGYGTRHVIVGNYKIPAGYAVESLPKDINIVMADKSIRFKRTLQKTDDGHISLRYEVDISRTSFVASEYPDLHEFFKKMYDMLDEQIVLKKS